MSRNDLLFYEHDLYSVIQAQRENIARRVQAIPDNAVLSRPIGDIVSELTDDLSMTVPTLDLDSAHVDQKEGIVEIYDRFADYGGSRGSTQVAGTIVTLHIPYSGEQPFFKIRPSTFDSAPPRAVVTRGEVTITISGRNLTPDGVKRELDRVRDAILKYLDWQRGDVDQFNSSLPDTIQRAVEARKQKLLNDQNLVSSLGYPLKKRPDAPRTYTAPVVRKKVGVSAPRGASATTKPFKPEPALDEATYQDILSIMHNMALVMERSPTAFQTMGEEDLRQHFLVQLDGQFEGTATGETFNFQGKTDILIRTEGRNIFIAECKFWSGPKAYLSTIDQLLNYLSWRDTKTAVVIFSRNKDFSNVLSAILDATEHHPNKKSGVTKEGETRFRYKFSNPSDPDRELQLTVMAFNIPGA